MLGASRPLCTCAPAQLEGKRGTVKDILVPHPMFTPVDGPTKVAWDEKEEVAWWRGAPDCTGNPHKIKGKEASARRCPLGEHTGPTPLCARQQAPPARLEPVSAGRPADRPPPPSHPGAP
jgi:hypothetical protein